MGICMSKFHAQIMFGLSILLLLLACSAGWSLLMGQDVGRQGLGCSREGCIWFDFRVWILTALLLCLFLLCTLCAAAIRLGPCCNPPIAAPRCALQMSYDWQAIGTMASAGRHKQHDRHAAGTTCCSSDRHMGHMQQYRQFRRQQYKQYSHMDPYTARCCCGCQEPAHAY